MSDFAIAALGLEGDTRAFEQGWARIRTQMELQPNEFFLGLVFTPDLAMSRELARRVNRHRSNEGAPAVRVYAPSSAAELSVGWSNVERVMRSDGAVLVIAPHAPGGDDATGWLGAWTHLLSAMNERRDWLRTVLHGPLLLVMHPALRPSVKFIAPDLWSYRSLVVEFRRGVAPAEGPVTADELSWPLEWGDFLVRIGDPEPPNPELAEALRELGRAERSGRRVGADEITRILASATSAADQTLAKGALAQHLRASDTAAALAFADEALCGPVSVGPAMMLALLQIVGRSGRPDCLVGLHWAVEVGRVWAGAPRLDILLDELGDLSLTERDLAAAHAVYTESLAVSRRLLAEFGERPESLRDLSVSLNNIGNVTVAQGDLAAAHAVYTESLAYLDRAIGLSGGNATYQSDRLWVLGALDRSSRPPT